MIDGDWGASGNVTDNVVANYDTGLAIYGKGNTGGDRTSHVHVSFANNSITGSAIYASATYWTGGVGSINAIDNWWGSATPNSSKFSDKIAYYPFCLNAGCTANIEDEVSEFTGDCTTNFSAISNWSEVDLMLDADDGVINWSVPVDLTGSSLRFSDAVEISYRRISVDTSQMPELDYPAVLTFASTGFTSVSQFVLLRNGVQCPTHICTSYHLDIDGSVTLAVAQMSEYSLLESPIYQNLAESGSGLSGFLTAITTPTVSIILGLGFVGGILVIVFSLASAIGKAFRGATRGLGR
jgi:hypothetical protein